MAFGECILDPNSTKYLKEDRILQYSSIVYFDCHLRMHFTIFLELQVQYKSDSFTRMDSGHYYPIAASWPSLRVLLLLHLILLIAIPVQFR